MKTSFFLIFLMAVCLPVAAQTTPASDSFYLEVGVVNDFPTENWAGYSFGAGGQAALGYTLDPNFSIQMNLSDLYYPNATTHFTDNEIRIYPELRFYFASLNDIQLYLIAGTGLDLEIIDNASATSWTTDAGIGIDWSIKKDMGLFVEAKWNWLTTNQLNNIFVISQDIPLLWGLRFGL